MMIEEYKETILHELERARNDEEVEQIINHSIEQFKDDDLYMFWSSFSCTFYKTDWRSCPSMILIPEYGAIFRTP